MRIYIPKTQRITKKKKNTKTYLRVNYGWAFDESARKVLKEKLFTFISSHRALLSTNAVVVTGWDGEEKKLLDATFHHV